MTYPTIFFRIVIGSVLACTGLVGLVTSVGHIFPSDELALDIHRTGQRDIYLMDLSHNLDYRVTHGQGDSLTPAWSPDGEQIAYVSLQGISQTIMVVDADGRNPRSVFTSRSGYMGNLSLSWSPDNDHLAFTALLKGRQVIYIISVTPDSSGVIPAIQVTDNYRDAFSPTWSPDGDHLAFSWGGITNPEIFIATMSELTVPITTSMNLRQITHTSAPDIAPAWSPDGKRIAFVSDRDANSEIYTMNPDGTDILRLTYNLSRDIVPSWTPDSQRVTFVSNRTGDWEVYTVDADCDTDARCQESLVQVTQDHEQGNKLHATWRPVP